MHNTQPADGDCSPQVIPGAELAPQQALDSLGCEYAIKTHLIPPFLSCAELCREVQLPGGILKDR